MINLKGVYWGGMRMAGKAEDREFDGGLQSWAELSRTCGWGAFLAEDAFGSLVSKKVWQKGRWRGGDPRSTRNEVSAAKRGITLSSPDGETTAAEITLWRLVYGESESICRWVEDRQMWRLGRCQQCGGRRPRPQRRADGETWDREEGKHKGDNRKRSARATTDNSWVTAFHTA